MPHWSTSRKKHTVPDQTCSDCSVEQGSGALHILKSNYFFWFFWMASPNSGKRKEVRAAVTQLYWTAPHDCRSGTEDMSQRCARHWPIYADSCFHCSHFYSAPAVLATAIPSVCLSVCPSVRLSHACIVSKRRHVARCSLHCQIAKCV